MNAIKEEASGALDYAMKSIMFKTERPEFSVRYDEMARDELKHANYLKEIGKKMISENEMSAQCKRAWISTVEFLLEKEKMVHEMLKTSS